MSVRSTMIVAMTILLSGSVACRHADAHGKKHNPVRYQFVIKNGIPAAYLELQNPLAADPENIAEGAALYTEHCASCHGPTGRGDGPDAKELKPKPPELASMMTMIADMKDKHGGMQHGDMKTHAAREMSMMTEGYLFWTVSEGGEAMESPMPGFKDVLSVEERWQVILFMADGFTSKPAQ